MDCPICKITGLNEGISTCPQCKTNLQTINLIEKAEKAYSIQKKQKTLWILLTIAVAVAFLISILLPSITNSSVSKSEYDKLNEQFANTQNNLVQAKIENEKFKNDLNREKIKQQISKCEEITYTVQWGENLFNIASAIYGDGYRYKKIASDNALKDANYILNGQQLIIRF